MSTDDTDMNDLHGKPELNSPELEAIAHRAAQLPLLSPSRDLWSGIEARIEAPVVALPVAGPVAQPAPALAPRPVPAQHRWRTLAVAASLLVAVTAGITYTITVRQTTGKAAVDSSSVVATGTTVGAAPAGVEAVSNVTAEQTFDREIGAMRTIIDQRRKDLDPATIAVLEKNLKVIDAAIAESKAALAKDPASAFLMGRLTHDYDTKLQLLRGVASIPSRS